MVSAKHKRKFTAAVALAAVCIFTGTILYAKSRLENAILTSTELSDQKIIVLDAGHGGMDGGCSSADGKTEKGINLNILLSVRDMARLFGYNVEATRIKDISIHDKGVEGLRNQKISDMENRLALFNNIPTAFAFLSIRTPLPTRNTAARRCSIRIKTRKASVLQVL